jgi:hypothetical protein
MGSGSRKRPRRTPDSPWRIFGLPLGDHGKSAGRGPFDAWLDRRITVDDDAYPHGASPDRAGFAMQVRLTRSGDDHDRATDRAWERMGITVNGQETPHHDPTDCA